MTAVAEGLRTFEVSIDVVTIATQVDAVDELDAREQAIEALRQAREDDLRHDNISVEVKS